MKLSLERLSARMRQGETIPLRDTAGVVLMLSIPSILEQIVVTAMEYIDAAMVGHIGAEATAAIGIVSSSTWLLHGILVGLYNAFSIQIAQYLGADRQQDARGVLRQAMLFNLAAGLAAAAFGIGISGHLPGWLGADVSLQANASAYFAIWSAALPFTMAMGMYTSMLRASGDALTPGLISVLVCVLDVVFNFFLINPTRTLWGITVWGAGLGVPGAALGTALATVVGGLLALCILLFREGPLCIHKPGSWKITRACIRNLGKVGVPLAAERAALSSAQVLQVRIVSQLGTVAIAANSLGVSAEGLCYMAGYGIQGAAIALIGQAVGAHRKDMAKRFAWLCTLMGMGIMTLTGAGLFAFAPALMSIFTADAAVIALGARVLRIEAFAEPMFGASIVASGAMQGAGDSTACFVLNLVSMWGIRLTLAFLLAPRLGLMGVWGAMCFELCVRGLLFLIRLARGKWLEKGALS
ncbi:MATE family efflux transporter [Faecalibacterium sp. DFI.5.82]|uniref:MATE family efflux transporter n=1 Tax=Faecalibacterium sp. DFI.5.82 TaxID=3031725 RepID=UPI0023B1F6F1|nr:MATE family efflux transporter [Faecalibacterium sp. DFI.5.82]MDE8689298.1 MATE family efflux transporter [Faecalibacterium sp. DFI.5.82]